MKPPPHVLRCVAFFILHSSFCLWVAAQPTAITYQGRLTESGVAAGGIYDLRFTIYDSETNGAAVGALTNEATTVSNGLFTATLDFGAGAFNGGNRWLQIEVRPGASSGNDPYTPLWPRQPITAAPYAIHAASVETVDSGVISNPSFIGTTTYAPLQLFVNNQPGFRLENANAGETPNLIGGFSGNFVGGGVAGATIGGGGENSPGSTNRVLEDFGTVGGGSGNTVSGREATVSGGIGNAASGWQSTVSGGEGNTASSFHATVGGGYQNIASDYRATVGGGYRNTASGFEATVGGGEANTADINYATVSGGYANYATGGGAAVGGGLGNTASGLFAAVGGGSDNAASGPYSAIGGGSVNQILANASCAAIPGGYQNVVGTNASYSLAAGHKAKANHTGTFVWADSQFADFASSTNNQFLVRAAGGVGINKNNPATALDVSGTVTAAAFDGDGSGLNGLNASAVSTGTLPDARLSSNAARRSGGNAFTGNQTVTGGNVGIGTASPANPLSVAGGADITGQVSIGITGADARLLVRGVTGEDAFRVRVDSSTKLLVKDNGGLGIGANFTDVPANGLRTAGDVGVGRLPSANALEVEGNASKTTAGSWLANSDRRIKEDIQPVKAALETLDRVKLVSFRYTDEYREEHAGVEDHRYLNVVAQDFAKVFPEHVRGSGEKLPDGSEILQVDTYPLTIYSAAAIQELNQKMEVRSQKSTARMQRLEAENAALRKELQEVKQLLSELVR